MTRLIPQGSFLRPRRSLLRSSGSYLARGGAPLSAGGEEPSSAEAWNPSDKEADVVLSDSNRTATRIAGGVAYVGVRSVTGHATGKWYAEATANDFQNGSEYAAIGLATQDAPLIDYAGQSVESSGYYASGDTWSGGVSTAGNPYAAGETVRIAFDADTGDLWFGNASGWENGGDPATGTSPTYSGISANTWFLTCTLNDNVDPVLDSTTINTGQVAFAHTIPTGFSPWG